MQLRDDAFAGVDCGEVGRPHGHRRGAAGDELECVQPGRDAPHAYHRHRQRCGHVVHHAQRDRLDGRTAQAAGAIAEKRLQSGRVQDHGAERVDQGETVGTGVNGGTSDGHHVGDVGCELHDDEATSQRPDRAHQGSRLGLIGADRLAARAHVRARDVQLVAGDVWHTLRAGAAQRLLESFDDGRVVLSPAAADAHEERLAHPCQRPQTVEEALKARVRQPDRVDHAAGSLAHAWRRVAGACLVGDRFGHVRRKREVGHEVTLVTRIDLEEVERARGVHDRVPQAERAERDREVDLVLALLGAGLGWGHLTTRSRRSNTGPSLQTRR